MQMQYVDNNLPFTCYMIRYVCTLSCFQGALTARQKVKGNKTWQIEFLSVSNSVFGIPIINKKFPQEESHAFLTYSHICSYIYSYIYSYVHIFIIHTQEEDKKEIRLWEITFLDEELRIMRAKNIKDRNATPFIFVLERKQPNRLISNLAGLAT